jgi:hypothetical protein
VRIIAFAFFLYGRVTKATYRGAQALDGLVSNPEGFRQRVFQGFALRIEGFLGWWRNCNVCQLENNHTEFLQYIPSDATGSDVTLPTLGHGTLFALLGWRGAPDQPKRSSPIFRVSGVRNEIQFHR